MSLLRIPLFMGALLIALAWPRIALSEPHAEPVTWTPVFLDGSSNGTLLVSYCNSAQCRAAEIKLPEYKVTPVAAPAGMTYAAYDGQGQRVFFSWNRGNETTTVTRNDQLVAVIPHLVNSPKYCGDTLYYFTTTGVPKVPGGSRSKSRAGFSYLNAWRDGFGRRVVDDIFLSQAGVNICGDGYLIATGMTGRIFDSRPSLTASRVVSIDLSSGTVRSVSYGDIELASNPVRVGKWAIVEGQSPGIGVFATVSGDKVMSWLRPREYPKAHFVVAVGDRYAVGVAQRYLPGLIPTRESGVSILDTSQGAWRSFRMNELVEVKE